MSTFCSFDDVNIYDHKNLATHMEEEDGIYTIDLHHGNNNGNNNKMMNNDGLYNNSIDDAYVQHPHHVIPRVKKNRFKNRTIFACFARCTTVPRHSKNHTLPHKPKYTRRYVSRRFLLSIIGFIFICSIIIAFVRIRQDNIDTTTNTPSTTTTTTTTKPLPKIIQFNQTNDMNYYEPETNIIIQPIPSILLNSTNINKANICPYLMMDNVDTTTISNNKILDNKNQISWDIYGQELVQYISEKHGVANIEGGQYSKHYGYGNNVVISYDGSCMAISYEGIAGYDKAFGTHIDIVRYNTTKQQWVLEETVTDVTRNHGHTKSVLYQSMGLSNNGQRLIFADGHGVNVYEYNSNHTITNNSNTYSSKRKSNKLWKKVINIPDPYNKNISVNSTKYKQYQFGIDLSTNCDGTVIAISGTTHKNGYVRIYEEIQKSSSLSSDKEWYLIGEIQNVRFGSSIQLDASGTRLVIGTIASAGWRGMVQVYDRHDDTASNSILWTRIGQPIVGNKPLEMWGGKVTLNQNGTILVVTSKNGDMNRVQAYQLTINQQSNVSTWELYGQELFGTGNQYEHYGSDIAINGDGTILAVGAPGDNELYNMMKNGKNISSIDKLYITGRIYMYKLTTIHKKKNHGNPASITNEWVRIDHNEMKSVVDGDLFGQSVSLSNNGMIVVGGAPRRIGKAYQHILGGVHAYSAHV